MSLSVILEVYGGGLLLQYFQQRVRWDQKVNERAPSQIHSLLIRFSGHRKGSQSQTLNVVKFWLHTTETGGVGVWGGFKVGRTDQTARSWSAPSCRFLQKMLHLSFIFKRDMLSRINRGWYRSNLTLLHYLIPLYYFFLLYLFLLFFLHRLLKCDTSFYLRYHQVMLPLCGCWGTKPSRATS